MWIVAGVLVGALVVAALAGIHTGPHAHAAAGVAGVAVAAWLVIMAIAGRGAPVLFALLGVDVVVAAVLSLSAWRALIAVPARSGRFHALESDVGVAVSDLTPEGIVRVRGEQWSAASVNGTVRSGSRVQVVRHQGLRLEVWGEEAEHVVAPTDHLFSIGRSGQGREPA